MAFIVVERNTFLRLLPSDEVNGVGSQIRSISTPRSWKPLVAREHELFSDTESMSTEYLDEGSGPESTEMSSDESTFSASAKLAEVQQESKTATSLQLSAQAYVPTEVAELTSVLNWVKLHLVNCPGVEGVVFSENKSASSAEMIIRFCQDVAGGDGSQKSILETAKWALLSAAESSQSLYVIGYGSRPFVYPAYKGFKASLCIVPQSQADVMCQEFLWCGACKQGRRCSLYHPTAFDIVPLTVILEACTSSAWEAEIDMKVMPALECQCYQ